MKQIASICLGTSIAMFPMFVSTLPASAQVGLESNRQHSSHQLAYRGSANRITPYALVSQSYQGQFQQEGIPSAGAFISSVRKNRITASQLVQVGIDMGRLPDTALSDESYIRAVDNVLEKVINTN